MKMRSESWLLRLQFTMLVGILVSQVLGMGRLSSIFFTITFFLTFSMWLIMLSRRISLANVLVLLILALSGLGVSVNALADNTIVSFSYFKKLIMFASTLMLLGAAEQWQPEKEDVSFVLRGNTLAACFLVLMYLTRREELYLLNGIRSGYLSFRFTNPNLAAAFLSGAAMLELIRSVTERGWRRGLHRGLAGFLIYFVFLTRSRNAQLVLALFLAGWLGVVLVPGRRRKLPLWLAVGIAMGPLVLALGYLLLVYHPAVQNLFSFLRGEGKELDSRVTIWRFALEAFLTSPLFGAYSQISQGTGASQMHNSHMDILASYGAIVLMLVCLLLLVLVYGQKTDRGSSPAFLCRFGFGALLLLGSGEAMVFSGGMGIYLYLGFLRLLANYDGEDWQ